MSEYKKNKINVIFYCIMPNIYMYMYVYYVFI